MVSPFRIVAAIVLLGLFAVLLPGCWDRREIDEQIHVLMAFIDLEEDGMLRVSAEVLGLAAGGGQAEATHAILSARGTSISEAVWNMRWTAEGDVSFAHTDAIFIGERLAEHGVREIVDSLAQNYDVRRHVYLVTVPGNAQAVLSSAMTSSRHSEQYAGMLAGFSRIGANAQRMTLNGFLRDLASEGIDPMLPRVILVPHPPVEHETRQVGAESEAVAVPAQGGGAAVGGRDGEDQGSEGAKEEDGPPIGMLTGSAIYRDDRLAGFLGGREALGLGWLMGTVRGRVVSFAVTPGATEEIVVRTHTSTPSIKATFEDGKPVLRCGVTVQVDLAAIPTTLEMTSPAGALVIEDLIAGYIEDEIQSSIGFAVLELGADPVGFGLYLSRWHPRQWEAYLSGYAGWREALREARFEVWSEVSIISTGLLRQKQPGGPAATGHGG